jgi:hypothetical protein
MNELRDGHRTRFNGRAIEKWLLKLVCGAVASGNYGGVDRQVPLEWIEVLFGMKPWPEYFSLRVPTSGELPAREQAALHVDFVHDGVTSRLKGVTVSFVDFTLVFPLGDFQGVPGVQRPDVLSVSNLTYNASIELDWPRVTAGRLPSLATTRC